MEPFDQTGALTANEMAAIETSPERWIQAAGKIVDRPDLNSIALMGMFCSAVKQMRTDPDTEEARKQWVEGMISVTIGKEIMGTCYQATEQHFPAGKGSMVLMITCQRACRVVGTLTAELDLHPQEPFATLYGCWVEESCRRAGMGTTMVRIGADWLRRHEATEVVIAPNPARFWQKCGFEIHEGQATFQL